MKRVKKKKKGRPLLSRAPPPAFSCSPSSSLGKIRRNKKNKNGSFFSLAKDSRPLFFAPRGVTAFARAYAEATSGRASPLCEPRCADRLPGKARRQDPEKCKSNEKESVVARDRRILEFPLSMSPE